MSTYATTRRRRKDPLPMIIGLVCLLGIPAMGYLIWKNVLNASPSTPVAQQNAARPASPPPTQQPPAEAKIPIADPQRPSAASDDEDEEGIEGASYFAGLTGGSGPPTSVSGAVDRVASQIHDALEVRKSLVVWLFDASASNEEQRSEVISRFETLYRSLADVTGAASADTDNAPLLSAVAAYGAQVEFLTEEPTADTTALLTAAQNVETQEGNVENTFASLRATIDKYMAFGPRRGRAMTVVLVSDEAGEDQQFSDEIIATLKKYAIRLHVIGASALFGVEESEAASLEGGGEGTTGVFVRRGPESRELEWIDLDFPGGAAYGNTNRPGTELSIGPYSLTRLCRESGGEYFALRQGVGGYSGMPMSSAGGGGDGGAAMHAELLSNSYWTATGAGASSLPAAGGGMSYGATSVDPNFIQRYQPRYMPEAEYRQLVESNRAVAALIKASQLPRAEVLGGGLATTFAITENEAAFVNLLAQAQRPAARVKPGILAYYDTLRVGEPDRAKITEPRWQAGFDLALGRAMAAFARVEGYVTMVATRNGAKFENEGSTTWVLVPADELKVSSQLDRLAQKSREYLQGVIEQHPGTPWAQAAGRELGTPVGWRWEER